MQLARVLLLGAALWASPCEPCQLSAGWRYLRISNGGPVGLGTCDASWDLYELRVFSSANLQLPYSVHSHAPRSKVSNPPITTLYDGDIRTFWAADVSIGRRCWSDTKKGVQWVILDLGSPRNLSFVQFVQSSRDSDFAITAVQVECSADLQQWSTVLGASVDLGVSHAGRTFAPSLPPTSAPSAEPSPEPYPSPAPSAPSAAPHPISAAPTGRPPTGHTIAPSAGPAVSTSAPRKSSTRPPRLVPRPPGLPPPPAPAPGEPQAELPGAGAMQAARSAAGVGAVAVAAVAPTAAMSANRLSVLLIPECPPRLGDPLPRGLSPLQLRLGGSDLHGGAVAGNVLVLSAILVGHLALFAVVHALSSSVRALRVGGSLIGAQGAVHFPSGSIIAALVLLQGTVTCGAVSLMHPVESYSTTSGAGALAAAAGFVAWCSRKASFANCRAGIHPDNRPMSQVTEWLCGRCDWLPRSADWVRRYGSLFRSYRSSASRFVVAELLLTGATGVLSGWQPTELPRCGARLIACGACCLLYAVALVAMRPYVARRANVIDVLSQVTLAGGLGCIAGAQQSGDPSHGGFTAGAACGVASAVLLALGAAADAATLARRVLTQQYWRLLRERIIADCRRAERPPDATLDEDEVRACLSCCFGRPFSTGEVQAALQDIGSPEVTPQELQDWMLGHLSGAAGREVLRGVEDCPQVAAGTADPVTWDVPGLWGGRGPSPLLYSVLSSGSVDKEKRALHDGCRGTGSPEDSALLPAGSLLSIDLTRETGDSARQTWAQDPPRAGSVLPLGRPCERRPSHLTDPAAGSRVLTPLSSKTQLRSPQRKHLRPSGLQLLPAVELAQQGMPRSQTADVIAPSL